MRKKDLSLHYKPTIKNDYRRIIFNISLLPKNFDPGLNAVIVVLTVFFIVLLIKFF